MSHCADDFGGLDLLGPGELAERARRDRPAVEGDIDGAGLRDEIAKLLGRKARGDDSMLRRLVDSVFSDQSLKQYLPQAFDGGMVVDFGTRGSRGAEVTIEAVSVGKPRPPRPTEETAAGEAPTPDGSEPKTGKFRHEHVQGPVKTSIGTARATVATDARSVRVPIPWLVVGAKLGGLVNARESELSSKTSRETKLKLEETDVPATFAEHDVTYRITVGERGGWLSRRRTERVGHHDVPMTLSWPKFPDSSRAQLPRMRVEALEHAEFTGIGDLYRTVVSEAGLRVNDPAVRDFRAWLEQLPAMASELLGGRAVREHFAFNGGRPAEVILALRARGDVAEARGEGVPGWSGETSRLAGASVSRTERASGETVAAQAYTRRHGFSLTLAVGLLSKATGGYAGVLWNRFDNTATAGSVAERHGSELKFSYKGDLDRLRTDLTYVVKMDGGGRSPAHAITVDGGATAWFRPEDKMPEDEMPGAPADPPGGDRFEVPDRLGARFRLDRATADTIVGQALNELLAAGAIRAADVPRLADRFRTFLDDHAREIVNGDGARFPLSAWRKHAPDLFVRGVLDRSRGRHVGEVPSRTVDWVRSLTHTHFRST
ncbi:hypothetical protein [Kutzneria sp. 744]|uniref:hypothetical protein n=1 Tax=Kutzneria sp. (strain 744) TaxID=345341 RepID=UPI0003EEDA2E|nr:hypothetical protein [Kutzneria sp. 744]EWM19105.1 PE-PGRS family protein [Kutzneria sp. 744]